MDVPYTNQEFHLLNHYVQHIYSDGELKPCAVHGICPDELRDVYRSHSVVWTVKPTLRGEKKCILNFGGGGPVGKLSLGRPRRTREVVIKTDARGTCCEGERRFELT
jgi:hypothetical protein